MHYGVRLVGAASVVLICIIYSKLLLLHTNIVLRYLLDVNVFVFINYLMQNHPLKTVFMVYKIASEQNQNFSIATICANVNKRSSSPFKGYQLRK